MSCREARFRLLTLLIASITAIMAVTIAGATPAGAVTGRANTAGPPVGPAGDAFYLPPSPLPPGRPGDLIRYRRTADVAGAAAYLVLYLSRSALNKPIAVSGTVLVPKGHNPVTMPIVGVGVGTVGLGDSCASSKSPLTIVAQALGALKQGWALAATDYEGLGTPGPHTYQVGRSEGHAVLDAVRAAERLPATGLGAGNKVGLWGYSQGGGAVGWAGQLQPTYAPELRLVGMAAGGVPADLLKVADQHGDGSWGFGLLPMTALGMDAAYPDIKLDGDLNPLGRALLGVVSTLCVAPAIALLIGRSIGEITTRNPLQDKAFVARVNQNKLGAQAPRVPVFLYHATLDEGVPLGQAKTLAGDWCRLGVAVTWRTYLGEHIIAGAVGQPPARSFLAARFAGEPATSTC